MGLREWLRAALGSGAAQGEADEPEDDERDDDETPVEGDADDPTVYPLW